MKKNKTADKHKNLIWAYKKYFLILLFGLFLTFAYFFVLKDIPSTARIDKINYPQSTNIYDRNKKLLYSIYVSKNQTFVSLSSIPNDLENATIAIEDKDFYKHGAIDPRGITRAIYSTLIKREVQGGSTITQQLVKNSLLTQNRTISRKIKEIVLSFVVESIYDKNKILEMYLNQVSYGGTAWGVAAASQVYFDKPVEKLNLSESAFLAGLPEAPSLYSPFGSHPELAKQRQIETLKKMKQQGYISEKQEKNAISYQLKFSKLPDKIRAPHFVFYVKDLLVQKYGQKMVEQGGFNVITSLDLDLQKFAESTVATEVAKLKDYDVSNGASVVTNPATGEILAMVGSHNYFDIQHDGNVNIAISQRQPGSSIKPINYAVGLLKGYTAATAIIDQPVCFPNPTGKSYCPVNYDGKYHGVVQMRFALGNSFNIPAVKMLKLNGVEDMIATASAMGIKTFNDPSRYGLSLTLGGGEVTMLDMTEAFGVFANQGYKIDLQPILKVTDSSGKVLEEYHSPKSPIFGKKVLPSEVTYIISHILLDNNARSMAFGEFSPLRIGNLPISVKTGTTNDFRDNWTIGYTASNVVAVWVGNNDNKPMNGLVSGITGAAPIWHKIMQHLVANKPPEWPKKPDNIVDRQICAVSGLLPQEGSDKCPVRTEYFIKGTEPKTTEPAKQKVFIDKATNDLAKPGQTDNMEEKEEILFSDPTGDRYCLTCPHPQ
ncbi:MAG: hypothetical protein A2857_06970 [Candidatus Levybacteria bacterium RIFCSPHIGHO2_01_FULL_36_15]|nr:MAG: hypothetical protein A2857_06970 [Candidatus Levybacteria bacterium RIFCSPHIGHO2_01_FULL_36_15]OGH37317.1 MAG: hypothetical protein A2905_03630 [Candidatus Levybacteria bacterium RIFCSPLOWO2_01_FULL_36_10]